MAESKQVLPKNEKDPVRGKVSWSSGKIMVTVFWATEDILLVDIPKVEEESNIFSSRDDNQFTALM